MQVVAFSIGFLMLLIGRKLPWIYVGGIAFIVGDFVARQNYFPIDPGTDLLIFALASMVLGVILGLYLEGPSVILATLIGGAYLITTLPVLMAWDTSWLTWQWAVGTGFVSLLLLLLWHDFTLIVLSTFVGTILVTEVLSLAVLSRDTVFLLFLILGFIVQVLIWQYET